MQRLSLRILGILTIFFSLFNETYAQHNNFKKLGIKDGLVQSDIYDICQDKRGYLWIASGAGVSLFDGVSFIHYSKTNGLSGNLVRKLFEDSEGRIWFGTNEGISFYDGISFHTFKHKNYHGSTALCFAEDKNQNLYIGTDDGGLNIVKFIKDSCVVTNLNESGGLSSNSVMDIAIDSESGVWLATYGGGINLIKLSDEKPIITVIKGPAKVPSDMLLSIEISEDDVWLGSYDAGAFKFSLKDLLKDDFEKPLIYNTLNGLNSNYIWDILISKDKRIWLASAENGINRLQKSGSEYINTSFTSKSGLSDNQILSLFEDKQQNVWIGTNGNGLNMFLGDYFSLYNSKDGLPSDKTQSVEQDADNNYWLSNLGYGLSKISFKGEQTFVTNYFDKNESSKFITAIATGKSNNKNIWLATDKAGIIKFDGTHFYNYTEKDGLINNRVYSIYVDSRGIVWSGTADGISRFDGVKFLSISTDMMKMQNEGVNSITEDNKGYIWFATSGGIARYKGEGDLRTFDEIEGLKHKEANAITGHKIGDIYIGTNTGGIYKYNHLKNDTNAIELVVNDQDLLSNSIRSLKFINDSTLIAGTYIGFDKIEFDKTFHVKHIKHYTSKDGFAGMECNDNAILLDKDQSIWFGTTNGIVKYSPYLDTKAPLIPEVNITDIQLFFKDVNWKSRGTEKEKWFNVPLELTLPYNENHLTFKFRAINFKNPDDIVYKFKLEGRDKEWSPSRKNSEETFSGIEPGTYTFMVMAQSTGSDWSPAQAFTFTIMPPWYKTKTFYGTLLIIVILLIYTYIRWREKKLIKEKEILEKIVEERTHEVVVQKHIIEEKHKEITDSINYAERIQRSFMASKELLDTNLNNGTSDSNYFVFFKPKDVVSGDFYWASILNNGHFALATADSTGHGVPGAIMSLLNITSLEKATEQLTSPTDILNHTRQTIIARLKKDGSAEGGKDGMDCSLICFDFKNKRLQIAAANNPVWIARKQNDTDHQRELIEIKPDKMPVGKHDRDKESFNLQSLDLKEGDIIYTLTDGFPDQFGGEKNKKFMSKNLKDLLLSNSHLPMSEQKSILETTFMNWVGASEQVDDVTVIGIRM